MTAAAESPSPTTIWTLGFFVQRDPMVAFASSVSRRPRSGRSRNSSWVVTWVCTANIPKRSNNACGTSPKMASWVTAWSAWKSSSDRVSGRGPARPTPIRAPVDAIKLVSPAGFAGFGMPGARRFRVGSPSSMCGVGPELTVVDAGVAATAADGAEEAGRSGRHTG